MLSIGDNSIIPAFWHFVKHAGINEVYVGVSAGSMVACKDLMIKTAQTLYEDELEQVENLAALGLVDFYFLPHLNSPHFEKLRELVIRAARWTKAKRRHTRFAIVSLATDGEFERRRQIIRKNDLDRFFVSILFVQSDKDADYAETLKKFRLAAIDCIFVDDRVVRGIQWGNKTGAFTIWLKHGKFSGELPDEKTGQPAHTIADLSELIPILAP